MEDDLKRQNAGTVGLLCPFWRGYGDASWKQYDSYRDGSYDYGVERVRILYVLNLSTLMSIPDSYYEAAKVDGGGRLQRFRYITLPLMKPAIIMDIFLSVVSSLQSLN